MADSLLVKSKIKETAQGLGMRLSAEAFDELNVKMKEMMANAAERAKGNKRSTIKACDC